MRILKLALIAVIVFIPKAHALYPPGQGPDQIMVGGQILNPSSPNTLLIIHASGGASAFSTFYVTKSDGSTPAAYQVTAGKKFVSRAIKWGCSGTSAALGPAIVYGDTSVTNSGTGPTNYVGAISQSSGSVGVDDQFNALTSVDGQERSIYVPFPASKYPALFVPASLSCEMTIYGYEQ